ncbi:MAG TPA: adenylate/guanylate cyclase domain-containing protein, partial [Acidimicrobiales bacterium]|nr:adenylate/guanylate cyclase domain-containing protein [Acidimicrobiales bacterium]
MDERLARHDAVLRDAFARHHGTVFSTGGDGFAVVFDDVGDAVVAALEVQAALAGDPLRVRMGIHVGRAVERDDDYFGPTLNRTARLMAVGHGGQVLLSEAAGALARSTLPEGVALLDLGTHQLRDLTRPEHVWQLQNADTPAFPALRSVGAAASNLPVGDELIGREVDTVRVVELARAHRLVTITGPGGVGKSSLALVVATELVGEAPDGTWLVELAPLADASGLVGVVAGVLPLPGMAASAAALCELIGPRRMLVILDNCEHLVDEVAALVSEMLQACPGVRLLCTSQETLALGR